MSPSTRCPQTEHVRPEAAEAPAARPPPPVPPASIRRGRGGAVYQLSGRGEVGRAAQAAEPRDILRRIAAAQAQASSAACFKPPVRASDMRGAKGSAQAARRAPPASRRVGRGQGRRTAAGERALQAGGPGRKRGGGALHGRGLRRLAATYRFMNHTTKCAQLPPSCDLSRARMYERRSLMVTANMGYPPP